MSDIERKRPTGGAWTLGPIKAEGTLWFHPTGIQAFSSVDDVEDDGPTFHVSVSYRGGRAPREAVRLVRRDFDMEAAEEDNHSPRKIIRSLWLPVNRDVGRCKCVHEPRVVTPFGGSDGATGDEHIWRDATVKP